MTITVEFHIEDPRRQMTYETAKQLQRKLMDLIEHEGFVVEDKDKADSLRRPRLYIYD